MPSDLIRGWTPVRVEKRVKPKSTASFRFHRNDKAPGRELDYGVAINPLAVAITQRLPQRTMDSTRPTPGMLSPRAAIRMPSGPSRTAVPSRTSTTVQPGIVAGLVSGAATSGCRIAIAGAVPALAWRPASGEHRPATGRVAWECCRQWRANPAPTPSFARLQPCGLIALRKSAARALLSAQRPED